MNIFSEKLIAWYAENKRELPWRNTTDPYIIWISEIILQQTRVAQGYDYFLRFIHRFPDVRALAEAPEDEVMKCWQGLGYYSRARNLHAAAKSMNGIFPVTYEGVRALKGVGDYTAAAICSSAYGMPYAVVDGNVYRVLSRYFGIDTPVDSAEGKKLFAALADEMMDKSQPAVYNQAIMDFGAIQCTPQSPNCLFCPLADSCSALKEGTDLAFHIKFIPFMHIFFGCFCQSAPKYQIVPFRPFWYLRTVSQCVCTICSSQRQRSHSDTGIKVSYFRVSTYISNQYYFIY